MRLSLSSALLLAFLTSPLAAQPVGLAFYRRLDELDRVHANVSAHYLSSHDRSGGNDDGFRGTYSALRVDERGEHVIFEQTGAGCVYNLWFTDQRGPESVLGWGRLRLYFDGEERPRVDLDANAFFSGTVEPFRPPFVTHNYVSSGGYTCSLPLPFARGLRITTERRCGFYNVYYHTCEGLEVATWTGTEEREDVAALFERRGSDPKAPVPTDVVRRVVHLPPRRGRDAPTEVVADLAGPGTVRALRIDPLGELDEYAWNHVRLRIHWDDAREPAVDVPLGPFFGSGLGETHVASLLFGMSTAGTAWAYYPMGFERTARLALVNESHAAGASFFCEVETASGPTQDVANTPRGAFHARHVSARPIATRDDFVLLDVEGAGHVVSQVMTVRPVHPDVKRWWEGDLRVYFDGESEPRFHGTGHEDEYQGGWSNFWLENPYTLPLFGEPRTDGRVDVGGQINARTTMYRIWPGGIPFRSRIRVSTEHGHANDTPANYDAVVCFYLR